MFITSLCLFTGKRESASFRSRPNLLTPSSDSNWLPVFDMVRAGNPSVHNGAPGEGFEDSFRGSTPAERASTQNFFTMKNPRKQQGTIAHQRAEMPVQTISDTVEDFALLNEKVFSTPPSPRQPESPDEESFRSLLKSNLPNHRASSELLQRIRSSISEQTDKI
jgi:hypothetical protein